MSDNPVPDAASERLLRQIKWAWRASLWVGGAAVLGAVLVAVPFWCWHVSPPEFIGWIPMGFALVAFVLNCWACRMLVAGGYSGEGFGWAATWPIQVVGFVGEYVLILGVVFLTIPALARGEL